MNTIKLIVQTLWLISKERSFLGIIKSKVYTGGHIAEFAEIAEQNLRNFTIFSLNTFSANIAECANIAEFANIANFLRFSVQITL
jgi:hypothetical protein